MSGADPELPARHKQELARAYKLLESNNFATRLTDYAGKPIHGALARMPKPMRRTVDRAVERAIPERLKVALKSLKGAPKKRPSTWLASTSPRRGRCWRPFRRRLPAARTAGDNDFDAAGHRRHRAPLGEDLRHRGEDRLRRGLRPWLEQGYRRAHQRAPSAARTSALTPPARCSAGSPIGVVAAAGASAPAASPRRRWRR